MEDEEKGEQPLEGSETTGQIQTHDHSEILTTEQFSVKRCCYHPYPLHNFDMIVEKVDSLEINNKEKKLCLFRLQRIFTKVSCLQKIYKYSYFYSRVFIVVASILAPTLTSINTDDQKRLYIYLWWIIWNLQILISLLTSVSTFFKWDRNYFLYSEFKDKIEEEIWHFLQSTHEYRERTEKTNINEFLQKIEEMYTNLCLKDAEIKLSNLQFTKNEDKRTPTTPPPSLPTPPLPPPPPPPPTAPPPPPPPSTLTET